MATRPLQFSVPSDGESLTTQMAKHFASLVKKEESSLTIEVRYKDHGGLKQGQELAALQAGSLDFATLSFSDFGVPFDALFRPYLIEGYAHLRNVVENDPFWEAFCKQVSEQLGVSILSVIYIGKRHIATKEQAINTPADLKGRVFRVPPGDAWKNMAYAFGATPKSIGIGEVVKALTDGTVDAVENPLPGMQVYKIDTVATTISLTGHMVDCLLVVQSNHAPLTLQQQKVVQEAAKVAQAWHDPQRQKAETQLLEAYRKSHVVQEVDVSAFQKAVDRYYSEHVPLTDEQQAWIKTIRDLA